MIYISLEVIMGLAALISDGIDREAPTKAVVQFDLDGHRVNKFESLSEAGNWMRKNTSFRIHLNFQAL